MENDIIHKNQFLLGIYYDIENICSECNIIIYGSYVSSKITREYYKDKFLEKKLDIEKYYDTEYDKETILRLDMPNDIDINITSNQNTDNFFKMLKNKGYSIIQLKETGTYNNVVSTYKINKYIPYYNIEDDSYPSSQFTIVIDINKTNNLFDKIDYEYNFLIIKNKEVILHNDYYKFYKKLSDYKKAGMTYSLMDHIINRNNSNILLDKKTNISIVLKRFMKDVNKGFKGTINIKDLDVIYEEDDCIICHNKFDKLIKLKECKFCINDFETYIDKKEYYKDNELKTPYNNYWKYEFKENI